MARIFVAVHLSPEVKADIQDVIEQLQEQGIRGRYERPSNLHITLAFVGETTQTEIIKHAVKEIAFEPFSIKVSRIGCFARSGILWLGLTAEKQLAELARAVRQRLDHYDITYSPSPFKAHITLARDASELHPEVDLPSTSMRIDHISVMETTYQNGHRVYVER
ncbi:MAG: RNA 2',3'-cyclic phosphodiesterase [Bacteroidales bacterium]|nr:RNA 2',3'-cyclic phosphodiesterase [Bacteroidales bacterium]